MLLSALLVASAIGHSPDSPNVWLASVKGRLTRAGREGDPVKVFDISPRQGAFVFRGRQIAFTDDSVLTWITVANAVAHSAANAKQLIGWRDTDPLLWDGKAVTTPDGVVVESGLRSGDTPVFASLFGKFGMLVSRTPSGTVRIGLNGPQPIAADFGHWRVIEARMMTAWSGFIVLEGIGSEVVRIGKGRADVVAMERDKKLGIAIASDGRAYVVRHDDDETETTTEVDEVSGDTPPTLVCLLPGNCELIDIDRASKCAYLVRTRAGASTYLRASFGGKEDLTLLDSVEFVTPAFGGAGFVADANPP